MPFRSLLSITLIMTALASCQAPQTPGPTQPSPSANVSASPSGAVQPAQVLSHYADLVHAIYADSFSTAQELQKAVDAFLAAPSQAGLDAAKAAWVKARVPYAQSEGFRFYDGPIDNAEDGPEGHLNAWPLDEVYIDAVQGQPDAGIVNQTAKYPTINEELLRGLNEQGGDKNISTGFHAIEFLLWGQDLTEGPGAGQRPFSDYTTAPNAARRGQYLKLVTQMLVSDLELMVKAWAPDQAGTYRSQFLAADAKASLGKLLKGIGTLSASELASERLATPLDIGDREEEHSCFSDNTHADMQGNAQSIRNVLLGSYRRANGSELTGPGLIALIRASKADLASKLSSASDDAKAKADALQAPFDQEIRPENAAGHARVLALVNSLQAQGRLIVEAGAALGIQVNTDL